MTKRDLRILNRRAEITYLILDGWMDQTVAEKFDLTRKRVNDIRHGITEADREAYRYRRSRNMSDADFR